MLLAARPRAHIPGQREFVSLRTTTSRRPPESGLLWKSRVQNSRAASDPNIGAMRSDALLKTVARLSIPITRCASLLMTPFKATPQESEEMDDMLRTLHANKAKWAAVSDEERADLLQCCADLAVDHQEELARVEVMLKGTYESGDGEALLSMVGILFGLRELREACLAGGKPEIGTRRRTATGQEVVETFPRGLDHILFAGFTGETWIQPGKTATQTRIERNRGGRVAVCLGAGNQIVIAGLDVVHMLICADTCVLVKMSEVNEACGPVLEKVFAPLVERGYVRFCYGGAEEGRHLTSSPLVEAIHITGSAATHDAIVWGPGAKKSGKPKLKIPVTSELGCVTPFIICPGDWTPQDIDWQAKNIVSALTHNSSHNCLAPEVLVTSKGWPLREAFLARIEHHMRAASPRAAYYPGSRGKAAAYSSAMPSAKAVSEADAVRALEGSGVDGWKGPGDPPPVVPWTLAEGLTAEQAGVVTLRENWCGVLTEVALEEGPGPESFLPAAVSFANDECWGSLSCALFVDPTTQAKHEDEVEAAIAELRYGGVCLNGPGQPLFASTRLPWGAFPGNTLANVGSGVGAVHNTVMLDHPEKAVLRLPWIVHPAPWWFYDHRNVPAFARAAARYAAHPSFSTLAPLANAAILG